MPTSTYEKIATYTLASAVNSYTFTTIGGTYTDLVLVVNATGFSTGGNLITAQFNSDTGSNYSGTYVIGTGSAAQSTRNANLVAAPLGGGNNGTGTGPATVIASLQNYSNTSTYKTLLSRFSSAGSQVDASVSLWRSTSAITSVNVFMYGGVTTMSVGSTFTLYGIKAA